MQRLHRGMIGLGDVQRQDVAARHTLRVSCIPRVGASRVDMGFGICGMGMVIRRAVGEYWK
jgi:hypothetical protein